MGRKTNYTGVKFSTRAGSYCASISHKGETINCGSSKDEREAARLRDLVILRMNLPQSKLQVLKPVNDK